MVIMENSSRYTPVTGSLTGSPLLRFLVSQNVVVSYGELLLWRGNAASVPSLTYVTTYGLSEPGSENGIIISNPLAANIGATASICFSNCPRWLNQTISESIALGMIVQDGKGDYLFIVTIAGMIGTVEPTWNTSTGATTTDNTTTWTCIGPTSSFQTPWAAPHARIGNAFGTGWGTTLTGSLPPIFVLVSDNHAETQSGALTITSTAQPAYPCYVLCVDHTASLPINSANLKTTASVTAAGININGPLYFNGVNFYSSSNISFDIGI